MVSGDGATTRQALSYWNEPRGVIEVGGASVPPDTLPAYIVIEKLEVRSGRPPYAFTDDGGSPAGLRGRRLDALGARTYFCTNPQPIR